MVDSIGASTSVIGHHLVHRRWVSHDVVKVFRPRIARKFFGQRLSIETSTLASGCKGRRPVNFTVKSLAMGLTKEANSSKEDWRRAPHDVGYTSDIRMNPDRLWPPSTKADDPRIHNPLLRQERLGCGWFAVIFEWEGVIVEDDSEFEKHAWLVLAQEEGKSPPPAFILKRIEGMKSEQAISEVLCWSRNPTLLRRLAIRKEEIHQNLQGGGFYQIRSGSHEFISNLVNLNIPLAVVSTRPRKTLEEAINAVGVQGFFDVMVAAEDVYRGKPDPEMFVYTAQLLSFIPERCIVFGNSNSTVEAAHDARMKCVAVANKNPFYELNAADLVVRHLNELSVVDLKNLADIDSPEFKSGEPEVEMAEEEDTSGSTSLAFDVFW